MNRNEISMVNCFHALIYVFHSDLNFIIDETCSKEVLFLPFGCESITQTLCFLTLHLPSLSTLRVGPALYDDAPPSATHGAATCIGSHGYVTDESPQHHRQHGCCRPADTHPRTPCTCHQGKVHFFLKTTMGGEEVPWVITPYRIAAILVHLKLL